MKSKFHKKLSLKKITIIAYRTFGGAANADDDSVPTQSSAFQEPTEYSGDIPMLDEDMTLSGNHQTCM